VPHHAAGVIAFHFLIWPQIAPANAPARDADKSISRLDDFRVGYVLDPNVTSAIHHSCAHNDLLPIQSCLTGVGNNSVSLDGIARDPFFSLIAVPAVVN